MTAGLTALRRLAYAALAFAFAHIVFGAIVRITGSGLGCGDHWPRCHGDWLPPMTRPDLVIEVTHRYLAAGLVALVLSLAVLALVQRRRPGVGGPGGVLRPAAAAGVLVVSAALFGAIVVKLELVNKYVIVVHLAIAIATLASLALAVVRAGGLGSAQLVAGSASAKTARGATVAVGLAFLAVVLGGLTAHIVGANGACGGFPHCRSVGSTGAPLYIHVVHRVIAFLLFFHLLGLVIATTRRREGDLVVWAARMAFGTTLLQLLVAAVLVELHLPPVLKSLHQAVGTLVWLSVFVFAVLARRAAGASDGALRPVPAPVDVPATREVPPRAGVIAAPSPTRTCDVTAAMPVLLARDVIATPQAVADTAPVAEEPVVVVAYEPEVVTALRVDLPPLVAPVPVAPVPVAPVPVAPVPQPDPGASPEPQPVIVAADVGPVVATADGDALEEVDELGDIVPALPDADVAPLLSHDEEVALALEALMSRSAVVDLGAGEDEDDPFAADDAGDRDDQLAELQAALRARMEETDDVEVVVEVVVEDDAEVVVEAVAGLVAEAAPADAALPAVMLPEGVRVTPTDLPAVVPVRRPPTLAVLIARGADF